MNISGSSEKMLLISILASMISAQENPRNTGLAKPQLEITLPVSRAAFQEAIRKEKQESKTELIDAGRKQGGRF